MDQRAPECRDRLTRETVAQLCEVPPFRGADAAVIEPLQRRGICFRLRFPDGRVVVVKRAGPHTAGSPHGSVAHEATVLFRLYPLGLPVPRPLATLTDPDGTVLVTEDAGGTSLTRLRAEAGGSSPAWAGALGRALAAVHTGVTPARLPRSDRARRLVHGWTVVGPRELVVHADGYADFLRRLRRDGLAELLAEAAAGWTPACLVHGDVRTDAVLCAGSADDGAVQVLDWEAAGHGDPRWDMGCLIGEFLASWLEGLDVDAGDRLEDWIASSAQPFPAVRAEIAAATTSYASVRPVTPGDRRQWVRCAAFPLVARACATALHSAELPLRSVALLQVADHLLRRPDESGELLLCP